MDKLLFITDLDGTLLHPRTYSFEAAREAMVALKERGIPLVFCSSKTRVEIEDYRARAGNTDPFVSENGGGVFVPTGYFRFDPGGEEFEDYNVMVFGTPYPEIRKKFVGLRERLGIKVTGFGDMTLEAIAELAGMTMSEAAMAAQRDFDEPFVFEKGEDRVEEFLSAVTESGLNWTEGRFYHLLGDNDKGTATRIIKRLFQYQFPRWRIKTVCLGDNPNDFSMLKEADIPVLVMREDGSYAPGVDLPGLIKSTAVGPEGWNQTVIKIIKDFKR